MKEIWVKIKGYRGQYTVSNYGRVYSKPNSQHAAGKFLKRQIGDVGYYQVNLYQDGKCHTELVHLLVAKAFVPNPDNLPEVNHKDLNKLNSRWDNLEWTTHKGNIHHSMKMQGSHIGSKNGYSKLNEDKVRMIRSSDKSSSHLGQALGVHPSVIRKVRRRITWCHVI